MAGHEWEDWFEREEFIGQISDIRVQNLQVEREVVQKRTFTRWMNLHLEKCDPPIEVNDLFQDIQDGRILMALLEELSGCKLLHGFKKSSHRIFRLNNIAKVLSFLEERNVKLVSIDAVDVADGNSSIILGLIWNIILFFQIKELTGNIRSQFPSSSSLSSIPTSSDSDASHCSTPSDERQSTSAMREHGKAIKKLLQWVQKRTRKYGVAVHDFGKSWTSGLAFLAVIKSIDPSLVDMRKALLRSARENLEDAFRIAHYSLGIPRLLETEDVTINTPDEQSIMTYVSQFLEHFPGIEEPEDRGQLIERSVSMGRLNFRDNDAGHIRRGLHQNRVKERSYMFQRDSAQPPPKILISSLSEDRSILSPRLKVAAARSWSSEDFLADSPQREDISSSVHEDPKEPASKVITNSISNSPQLSYTHSPTGSSVPESVTTESVIGDSAISSPDSWVESEFGVMPEKFCESRSDSSLCDSGTAWDVYRATPVEVTPLDEGFSPCMEDRAPDEQSMTESCIDEGIYSLSSLQSTQDTFQGHSEKKQVEMVEEKELNLENHKQDLAEEQVPDQISKEVDPEQIDASQLHKDKVPGDQEPSSGPCVAEALANSGAEELLKADKPNHIKLSSNAELPPPSEELVEENSVQESPDRERESIKKAVGFTGNAQNDKGQINGQTEQLKERNNSEEVGVETEGQKTNSPSENKREKSRNESEILKEINEGVVETQDEGNYSDSHQNDSSETCKALQNTHSTNQEGASNAGLEPSMDMTIPLISISSESQEQDEKATCGSPSCLVSENIKPTHSEHIRGVENEHLETDERIVSRSSNADGCGPGTTDNISETKHSQPGTDLTAQSSSSKPETQLDIDSTDRSVGQQDKPADTSSDNETSNIQHNLSDPVNSISRDEPASGSRVFYTDFDRSSPTEDLVGDPVEPMDLFYPDKEEPMFTEPPDTEMQSWPSVLSVSALQPAPISETLPDDQQLNLLGEDLKNSVDLIQEQDKVITRTNQESDNTPEPRQQRLLPGENKGKLLCADVLADGSDLSEADQQNPASARENTEPARSDTTGSTRPDESQIPPVLRHRKGARFTDSMDNQRAVPRKADSDGSDVWWSESSELYLLLLLWLLLYCFWLLPQMDLKTLPSLLLNR